MPWILARSTWPAPCLDQRTMRGASRALALATLGLAACGSDPEAPRPTQRPADVLHPTRAESISLERLALGLDRAWEGPLRVASHSGRTVVGGRQGLFERSGTDLRPVDGTPVNDVAAFGDAGLIVARDDGLFVFDGVLRRSPITDLLPGGAFRALAVRDDELWIGSDAGLFFFSDGNVAQLGERPIREISSFQRGIEVVARTADDHHLAYRFDFPSWFLRDLSDEGLFDHVLPLSSRRILGTTARILMQRIDLPAGRAVWRDVSLDIDPSAPGEDTVEAMALDPESGAAWVVMPRGLFRVDAAVDHVSRLDRPTGLGPVTSADVSDDGALWLGDGVGIWRVGDAEGAVSWAERIAPLSRDSCNECHKRLGTAPMTLETYEAWVFFAEKIVERMAADTMPPAGSPLIGGDVALVRRWKDGGLRP
jgi:hypothetical protein